MRLLILPALSATLCLATVNRAEAQDDSPGGRGNRITSCDQAVKTVANGRPAHKEAAALEYLQLCGSDGARQMAGALAGTKSEADTTALIQFYYKANPWRDADVMNAAMQLVADPGATTPARVHGILSLMHVIRPGLSFPYSAVIRGPKDVVVRPTGPDVEAIEGLPCQVRGFGSGGPQIVGTPLPRDFVSRIHGLLSQIADDATVPEPVRNAAACGRRLD